MLSQQMGETDNDGLGLRAGRKGRNRALYGSRTANHTDQDSHCHGNYNPDAGNPAGKRQLILVFDSHKTKQDMRHSEIPQSPRHGRYNRQQTVGASRIGGAIMHLRHGKISGQ